MKLLLVGMFVFHLIYAQNPIDISGSFRARQSFKEAQGNSKNTGELRTRLNFSYASESAKALFQLQDSRIFGSEASTLANTGNIDLHQAYLTFEGIFSSLYKLSLGRKELAFDNQRFVGSVGWHNVGRSFDGVFVSTKTEERSLNLFFTTLKESVAKTDSGNVYFYGFHGNWRLNSAWRLSGFYYERKTSNAPTRHQTVGFYNTLKTRSVFAELHYARQFGKSQTGASIAGNYAAVSATIKTSEKLALLVSYETISGDDTSSGDFEGFDLLYGTNHKFNGIADKFFVGGSKLIHNGLNSVRLGLKWNNALQLDAHVFFNGEKTSFNTENLAAGETIASEYDFRYSFDYSKNVRVNFGAAYFSYAETDITYAKDSDLLLYAMCRLSL
jgi:hypothetical protein